MFVRPKDLDEPLPWKHLMVALIRYSANPLKAVSSPKLSAPFQVIVKYLSPSSLDFRTRPRLLVNLLLCIGLSQKTIFEQNWLQ